MNIENLIENALIKNLIYTLPKHKFSEIYHYALLPGGKFFRPKLIWAILKDFESESYSTSLVNNKSPHSLLASAIECHHAYSLIHDDLPSMDNDSIRRGKASTHIAFGEWQAILAGDGLLNLSYELILKIPHPNTLLLLKLFSWSVGPKGLIQGQVLDLSLEMNLSFENLLQTHELKTARLIQISILGSYLLTNKNDYKIKKNLWKFGRLLGVIFQLLDDLTELTEKTLQVHELNVNPWISNTLKVENFLIQALFQFKKLKNMLNLKETNLIVENYFDEIIKKINENQSNILIHLNGKIQLTQLLHNLNNFRN